MLVLIIMFYCSNINHQIIMIHPVRTNGMKQQGKQVSTNLKIVPVIRIYYIHAQFYDNVFI